MVTTSEPPSAPLSASPTQGETYLARLNPEQRAAIETTDGPLLVLAGAGTGKTRVLTTRFAHILLTGRAKPWQILAVTFTNKAAREMRERVSTLLGNPAEGLWLGTFHALCARMLRRHAETIGLTSSFTILDTDDQLRLLKQVMEPWRLDTKRWPAPGLLGVIQRWKDRGLTPARVTPAEDTDFANGHARAIYDAYQQRLKQLNACDFGDLMLHVTEILRTHPDILAQYHRLFRYILVDEYQDTNTVQYLWLRLLAKQPDGSANICCVGDDDQSIYSWRGAEVENILRFEKDFPGAQVVRLERNYRSTRHILGAAAGLIAHNGERLGKTLRSGREDSEGEKVRVVGVWDSDAEARSVCERAESLRRQGHSLAEMAILVRAGFQTRAFEERLVQTGLPYRIVGGIRFYERAEIRDTLAYLRVLNQPADDLAFERIVNTPKRGVGPAALQKLHASARGQNQPLTIAARTLTENGTLKGKLGEQISTLLNTLDTTRDILARDGHVVATEYLLEESGYLDMWRQDRSPEAPGRLENLKELVRALADFPTLGEFLEHVALVMEQDENAQEARLSIMTLHGAKGLEFDIVFLPGWEEGVFPSQRTLDEGGLKGLEEERRLAYVGITRARKLALIYHAGSRRIYANWQPSMPSRFLDELPEEHITRKNEGGTRQPGLRTTESLFAAGPLNATPGLSSSRRPSAPRPAATAPAFALGQQVRHPRFGEGTVIAVDRHHVEVAFEAAGTKRLLSSFIEKL
ncbi:ATP-dependent helicase [Acetobacter peroxydans]|uniref:ATP-dependent helicase n=1 Tax=Acetobacter peroxydans TaxID=104098 RepID=UPI0023555BD8|nr:UvrD-helicase domain-containing protein [Acetobacter peroxydans]MCH4144054.1 UvrD-helicase domain-containing protein [Acetobacter peroxydans]MCI1394667.1 UvrD-helicase domain-containing protein [Acetobacter peroxydans]MCI1410166.1 UvrD-helicase domain-containing protein [Acetobacter peroxydans]MCI1440185.1 UvrD-helicase domain-containing protein [Acetobacter peroxydans]MCI1565933.1 UvrD-helicase domain-containing protein [Acetobacter peroxydans]